MNVLDIVISMIVVFCLVRGIFRGIIKELTSIIGVFVGFYGGYMYYPLLARWLSNLIADKPYLNIISFLLTFTILFIAIGSVGVILKHLIPITAFLPKNSPVIKHSIIAPHVSLASEKIVAAVPRDLKEKFRDNIKSLKASWKKP
jgi:membrane protein required for colicin V production